MKKTLRITGALAAMVLSLSASAQSIIGITTSDEIFTVASAGTPGTATTPVAITGLTLGQTIAGVDYRPNTGELYALGYNVLTTDAQLYTINATTGVATAVGASVMLDLGTGNIGFDFNPTVDRIRVVGANQNNYRLHPVTGAIAATDVDLAYAATDVNAGANPSVGAVAYTNSYIGSEATTLYDYDEALNVLTTQIPPNNGTLNTIGSTNLSLNPLDMTVDMDIWFDSSTQINTAYLAANTGLTTSDVLYTINLSTGATTNVGTIGSGIAVKDIAVVIHRNLSAITGGIVYGLTKVNRNLITFDRDNPSVIRSLMPITGVTPGQLIMGMDFRPATNELYAFGYNTLDSQYQIYKVDSLTGVATPVNATPDTMALGDGNVGFDFNPVPDRIRIVGGRNRKNYRANPTDGTFVVDTDLDYVTGDANFGETPYIGSVAYTNSYAGATTTALYGIDDTANTFIKILAPNAGTVSTINANFLLLNSADLTTDLDFYYNAATMSNIGLVAASTLSSTFDYLYTVDTMGITANIGSIGFGVQIRDIAVRLTPGPTSVSSTSAVSSAVIMYPNPANNSFAIHGKGDAGMVQIADMTGRIVNTIKDYQWGNQINIQSLTSGIYSVTVVSGEMKNTGKLMVR